MKNIFSKILFSCILIVASFASAHASTLNGSLSFTGTDKANGTTSINFGGTETVGAVGTGSFSAFTSANFFNFQFDSRLQGNGEILFQAYSPDGKYMLRFKVSQYSYDASTLTYTLGGELHEFQYLPSGMVSMVSTTGVLTLVDKPNGTFAATLLAPAPEPGSLVLLGTGVLFAAVLAQRRRLTA